MREITGVESAVGVTSEDEEVADIFGAPTPNALVALAQRLKKDGVVLFDGLQGAERRAAETLIGGRSVEVYETEGGFTYLRPFGLSILNILRGQVGRNSVVNRLARGDVPKAEE